ncbi:MAG: efflux RND transporter periplasmic adaptor subunit [Alphaproteobacteria bacterium]|nr:efflux RND transporter periplasmic adaptor subunit [Alphaproteobacteria bacterium]
MGSSKIIAVFIAVVALLWIGSGFILPTKSLQAEETSPDHDAAHKPLIQVRFKTSRAQNYADQVIVTGRTQASRDVEMKAEITGEVISVLKEEGQHVSEGDVLAEIELRNRAAAQAEARQRVEQRQIEYNAAKKLADKGFNSKVRLAQALADLENAKAALKQAQVDVNKTKITAAFDGVIARQDVENGDYVSPGDPVFRLIDLDPIELVGFVSERHVQVLTLGASASAAFLDGTVLQGAISYISPVSDEQTRTFRVIVRADNPDLKIKDGLTAKMALPASEKQAHRISPSVLTLDTEGRIGVKIVDENNAVQFMPVEILSDKTDSMWVAGLPAQVRLITVGQDFVASGQTVEPIESQGEGLL